MYVLDTNVLSEPMRAHPAPNVTAWLAAQAPALLFATAVTEAELLYGVALHPDGPRKAALDGAVRAVLALPGHPGGSRPVLLSSVEEQHHTTQKARQPSMPSFRK